MEDKSIEELGLSKRTTNGLKRSGVDYLSELLVLNEGEISNMRGLGKKSVSEVLEFINHFNNPKTTSTKPFEKVNNFVINDAFPEIDWGSKIKVLFKNNDGLFVKDVNLCEYRLSQRTLNSLSKNGVKKISEVAFMSTKMIKSFHHFGNTCYEEIIALLKEVTTIDDEIIISSKIINDIYKIIKKRCKDENKQFEINSFETVIKQSIMNQNVKIEYNTENELEMFLENQDIVKRILNNDIFIVYLCNYIYSIIVKNSVPISKKEIESLFPSFFANYNLIANSIKRLVIDKRIHHVNGGYLRRFPTLTEWIDTLSGPIKEIVKQRLSGKTLEECGKEFGITRERVRQIVSKALFNRPQLKEDQLRYWFKEYNFDLNQFCSIFDVDKTAYYYLDQVCEKGSKQIEEIIEDSNTTRSILSNLEKELRKNRIYINGKYLPRKRIEVIGEFGRNICSEDSISFDDFYREYIRFLHQIGRETDSELVFPSKRAFEANLSLSQNYLLQYGRKVRFYPLSEYDIEDFLDKLDLKKYKNIEISTLKIYRDNQELMEEYNIQNEYELHNLLKKTIKIWNKKEKRKVDISRMPFIAFGKASREKQTIDLLYRIAPVTAEEFGKAYEEEYGVLTQTAMANMHKYIAKYFHAGVYSVNQELLEKEEKKYLLLYLKNDFYFIDDVIEDFEKKFGNEKTSHINPRTIQELGYKVFTKCIVNKKYQSLEDYFITLLTSEEIIDLNTFDQRILSNHSFYKVLNEYKYNFELLEFEEKKYISFTRFHKVLKNISKEELKEYVNSAIRYSGNKEYFTITSLKNEGFTHQLHDISLSNWFFASLIKNSRLINTIEYGKARLFYKSSDKKTAANFIESIMESTLKMDVDKLVDLLKKEYGIIAIKEKLIGIVRSTDMYYDSTMNKVYIDKSYYYEDLK